MSPLIHKPLVLCWLPSNLEVAFFAYYLILMLHLLYSLLRILMTPSLKPTFKYATNLNTPAEIQADAHAKGHGLKIVNQFTDVINNLGNQARNDQVLQKLGSTHVSYKISAAQWGVRFIYKAHSCFSKNVYVFKHFRRWQIL